MSNLQLVQAAIVDLPKWFPEAITSGEVPKGKEKRHEMLRQALTLRAGTDEWELAYEREKYRLLVWLPVSDKLRGFLNALAGSKLFSCRFVEKDGGVAIKADPVHYPHLFPQLEIGVTHTWGQIGGLIASTARENAVLDAQHYLTGLR